MKPQTVFHAATPTGLQPSAQQRCLVCREGGLFWGQGIKPFFINSFLPLSAKRRWHSATLLLLPACTGPGVTSPVRGLIVFT